MAAGSSPAVAGLTNGGFEVVFAGQDNYPRALAPAGTVGFVTAGLTVAPGTSPAIAALSTGGYEIAFGAGGSSGTLWTVTGTGTATNTGAYPAATTSPAITALPARRIRARLPGRLRTPADHQFLRRQPGHRADDDPWRQSQHHQCPGRRRRRVGLCMDVAGANPANATQAQLSTCNGTNAQVWTMADDSTLRALDKCLDVGGTSIPVRIWDCNGTGAQAWQLTATNQLKNPQSGQCLSATGGNSTPLFIKPCLNKANREFVTQVWYLPPESSWTVAP